MFKSQLQVHKTLTRICQRALHINIKLRDNETIVENVDNKGKEVFQGSSHLGSEYTLFPGIVKTKGVDLYSTASAKPFPIETREILKSPIRMADIRILPGINNNLSFRWDHIFTCSFL